MRSKNAVEERRPRGIRFHKYKQFFPQSFKIIFCPRNYRGVVAVLGDTELK
jgi:hypothetical protein